MDITQTIIYRGLSLTMHTKRAFMQEILQYKQVMDKLVKLLMEEKVNSKLSMKSIKFNNGTQFRICEEDLDYLFDEMIGKKASSARLEELPEKVRHVWFMYKDLFQRNGEEVVLDVTNFLVYAIVKSKQCTKRLYAEIEENQLYDVLLEAFGRSKYKAEGFEKCLDAREISASRLARGLIALFKEQKSEKMYQMIINILNAGFSKKRKALKTYGELDSDIMRELQKEVLEDENFNALLAACEQIVIYVLAEDLCIDIYWDFTLLSAAYFYDGFANELNGTFFQVDAEDAIPEAYKEELKKVTDKYGTCNSVTDLFYGRTIPDKEAYLAVMMHAFQISPRKLQDYELTTQEIVKMMDRKEHWSTKDYMYCMIIAVLCKYIRTLEEIVAETDTHQLANQKYRLERQQENLNKLKQEIDSERDRLKERKSQYNKSLLTQERQIESLQVKEQALLDTIDTYEQELKELRSYVYGVRKEWIEESDIDVEEQIKVWQERKVIVFGGHSNWQRKLKEKFPKWQFVIAEIKSFSNDLIRDKEYIICNTDMLSHASYYKIVAGRNKKQKMLYVRSNNLDLCIKELCMQLG